MVRLIVVVAAFALVTLPLMPIQWAAVAMKRPLRRRIPVAYHRFVCRLLGIRVHLNGAPANDRPLLIVANHSSWLDITIITSLATARPRRTTTSRIGRQSELSDVRAAAMIAATRVDTKGRTIHLFFQTTIRSHRRQDHGCGCGHQQLSLRRSVTALRYCSD